MSELAIKNSVGSIAIQNMDDLSRMSKMMSDSGYFKDAKDAAQAGVKIMAGLSMGIDPFSAMTGIHVIQGKPAAGAGLMASAIKRHPNYNYRVLELTDTVCRIQFFEGGEKCGIAEFTAADAEAAGTQNMKKFPKNMLFARCISNGVRFYCPDVFDAPVYTPEEMGTDVDGDGEIIDLQPEPHKTQRLGKKELIADLIASAPEDYSPGGDINTANLEPVGAENNVRFRILANELGLKPAQIKAVAQSSELSTNVAELTAEETEQLEQAVRAKFPAVEAEAVAAEVA